MNAPQPIEPVKTRRRVPSKRYQRSQPRSYKAVRAEAATKLVVNGVLLTAAIAALTKLIPYYFNQQVKLQEIQTEVGQTEEKVNHLSSDFHRNFAPQQAERVMQEQTTRVEPNERPIVWLDQDATGGEWEAEEQRSRGAEESASIISY